VFPISSFSKELADKLLVDAIMICKENAFVKVHLKLVLRILARSEVVTSIASRSVSPAFSLSFSTLKLKSAKYLAVSNIVGLVVKLVQMAGFQSMAFVYMEISTAYLLTIKEIVLPVNRPLFLIMAAVSKMFPIVKLLPVIDSLALNVKIASN